MAYGAILGQTPAPPASNVSYNNSGTSGTISSTNVQGALDNIVTKTNSLQSQINTTNSNLTSNVNNLQGQINSLSSQIGSGLKRTLVWNQNYTQANRPSSLSNHNLGTITIDFPDNLICVQAEFSGNVTVQIHQVSAGGYAYGVFGLDSITNRSIVRPPTTNDFPCVLSLFGDSLDDPISESQKQQTYNLNSCITLSPMKLLYIRNTQNDINYSGLFTFEVSSENNIGNYEAFPARLQSISADSNTLSFYLCINDYTPGVITSFNVNLKIYAIS